MPAPRPSPEQVVRRCAEVLRREPRDSRALLEMGAALHALGRLEEAHSAFSRAAQVAPGSIAAWSNLAATLADLGEADSAIEAARRALALDRKLAAAHLNLGDALRLKGLLGEAIDAYREAVRLQPDSAVAQNKLGCAQQVSGDLAAADATLSRAVALAPGFWLARLNLVTVKLSRGARREARALLAATRSIPELYPGVRGEAAAGLLVLDEQERLEPALRAAMDAGSPQPIEAALASTPSELLGADEPLIAFTEELVSTTLAEPGRAQADFPSWAEYASVMPVIEAHMSAHRKDTVEALRESARLLAGTDTAIASRSPGEQDLVRYVWAVEEARRIGSIGSGGGGGGVDGGLAAEARIRYWHARLSVHRADLLPGHFKAMPNIVVTNPSVRRVAPKHVAGTVRRFFAEVCPRARAGPMRAALVYFFVAQAHAFIDGNGRLGRFLCGRELEAAGYCPAVAADALRASIGPTLARVRSERSLRPLMDHYAKGAWVAIELARALEAAGIGPSRG